MRKKSLRSGLNESVEVFLLLRILLRAVFLPAVLLMPAVVGKHTAADNGQGTADQECRYQD